MASHGHDDGSFHAASDFKLGDVDNFQAAGNYTDRLTKLSRHLCVFASIVVAMNVASSILNE